MDSQLKLFSLFSIALFLIFSTVSSVTMRERHEQWMAKHGRSYESVTEKEKRFHIFKQNVRHIETFNRGGNNSYKLGLNKFTDLTDDEFFSTYTGIKTKFTSHNKSSSIVATKYEDDNLDNLIGDRIDWREHGAVTPVKEQGGCAACWAFSSVAAIEGIYKIKSGKLVSFSEQNLIDCEHRSSGCQFGGIQYAYEYATTNGIELEQDYPYAQKQGQCRVTKSDVTISGYVVVTKNDVPGLISAVNRQPVSVNIDSSGFRHYSSGLYNGGCSSTSVDHSLAVIGYGTDSATLLNYWLVKNSWGTSWGEQGYMKILMDSGLCPVAMEATYPLIN